MRKLKDSPGQTPTQEIIPFIWFGSLFVFWGPLGSQWEAWVLQTISRASTNSRSFLEHLFANDPSHPAFPKGCVSCLVGQLCSNSRQRGIFLNAIPLIKTACTLWLKHIRIHSEAWRLATSWDLHFQFDYRPHPSSEQRFDACMGMQWEALQGGVAENRLPRTQEFKSLALLFKHRVSQNWKELSSLCWIPTPTPTLLGFVLSLLRV